MRGVAPSRRHVSIDTNVFVSGLIVQQGWPYLILQAWRSNQLRLTDSSSQYAELAEVLRRQRIQVKYGISEGDVDRFLRRLVRDVVPDGLTVDSQLVRDPDDAVILATAIENGAHYLITGDRDLLAVAADGNAVEINIVTPRQFAEQLSGSAVAE